jgi:hypothetical protein
MPRLTPITGKTDVPAEHHAAVDAVVKVFGSVRGPRTDPALFDRLHRRHGAAWMVEVTTAVHYFALVAGVANAFEIAPPPDGDRLPA